MSLDTRKRVICLHQNSYSLKEIKQQLNDEDILVSITSICLLIKKYKSEGMITDRVRPTPIPSKLQLKDMYLLDEALANDDELSTRELQGMLQDNNGTVVSISTIQRAKQHLGEGRIVK